MSHYIERGLNMIAKAISQLADAHATQNVHVHIHGGTDLSDQDVAEIVLKTMRSATPRIQLPEVYGEKPIPLNFAAPEYD